MGIIYSEKVTMKKTLQIFQSGTVLYSIHVTERISCTFCEIVSRKILVAELGLGFESEPSQCEIPHYFKPQKRGKII